MAIQIGNEERFEPAGIPEADGMMEELLSELLASSGPWLPGPKPDVQALSVQALSVDDPAPPAPIAAAPVQSLQIEDSPAAPSAAPQPEVVLPPASELSSVAELVGELIPSGEGEVSVNHQTEPTPVEPEMPATPLPESEPVAEQAPALIPEPVILKTSEPEPTPASVEPAKPVAGPPPATGELDTLIAAIDGEVAAGPRLTFETSLDSTAGATVEKKNCIVFSLDETRYAVSISNVIEMDKIPRITPVPNVPAFVRGVTNLRGEIVSVLDLRVLLGLSPLEQLDRGRILVVRAAGGQQTAALVVDEVRGIATVPLGRLRPPAGAIEDKVIPLLSGVCEYDDTLLNVLSLEKLFRSPEIHQLDAN
jgi:purine-binding chemotaxis protein CheW